MLDTDLELLVVSMFLKVQNESKMCSHVIQLLIKVFLLLSNTDVLVSNPPLKGWA